MSYPRETQDGRRNIPAVHRGTLVKEGFHSFILLSPSLMGDHGKVIILQSDGDWAKVMADAAGKKVIVDFTATWCGPCRMIAPFFQELSEKYPGLVFLKVDVDQCEGIAAECGIQAMPTFQVYDSTTKQKVDDLVGASKESLEKMVQKYA